MGGMRQDSPEFDWLAKLFEIIFVVLIGLVLLSGSSLQAANPYEAMRRYTREVEFDFSQWTLDALFQKAVGASLKAEKFFTPTRQSQIVEDYITQVRLVGRLESDLQNAVSAPRLTDRDKLIPAFRAKLNNEQNTLDHLSLLAESILQTQTEHTLARMGFGLGGQVLPPLLYKVTPLPMNLIVSPREKILTVFDLSLQPGLDVLTRDAIETDIFEKFHYSALVEPVGGLGAYPTMVMRTSELNWLSETIAHEWIHNYLTFHPLGIRYDASPQMRTINETIASLAGKEISLQVLKAFYPSRVPLPHFVFPPQITVSRAPLSPSEPFDFRAQMRLTRVRVDELLAQNRVEDAETYMENRRSDFWANGYRLRKINQAYFAFYGSYNDTPGGGASGDDPVGPAVQALRARFTALHDFIRAVQDLRSFAALQEKLQ